MGVSIYFVSLITRDNRPLHIQKFSPYERKAPQLEGEANDGKDGQKEDYDSNKGESKEGDKELAQESKEYAKEEDKESLKDSKEENKSLKDNKEEDKSLKDNKVPTLPSFIDEKNANELLKYNFLSNMALDVFSSIFYESTSIDQNCALLFVQDGISVYGYETNTGLKIVIGTATKGEKFGKQLDGIFKTIHKAYLRLICNPFQPLDENSLISSKKLEKSIVEVVDVWNSQC